MPRVPLSVLDLATVRSGHDSADALRGTIEIPGPPIRFDDNAFAGGRSEHLHPPLLGEHNESVRAWLDRLDADTAASEDDGA